MSSRLSIYNGAARMLGEPRLQSLTEPRESRRKMDEVWDDEFIKFVLEAGQWKFATRYQRLTYSPSVEPAYGYRYAFQKPTDHIRTTYLCEDEYYRCPLRHYQQQGGYWFADWDTIYIAYVSNDSAYGGDLSLWPAKFSQYVEAHLACEVRQGLAQNQVLATELESKRLQRLAEALSVDSMEDPTRELPAGSWVTSRTRNSRYNWER